MPTRAVQGASAGAEHASTVAVGDRTWEHFLVRYSATLACCVALLAWSSTPRRSAADPPAACTTDDRLSSAAAELLLDLGAAPDAAQLTAAVRAAGSDAVGLHAVFVPRSQPNVPADWLHRQRERADAALHCGSAQGDAGGLWIVSARGGGLQPISSRERVVRGELAQGFTRAELVVASADGRLSRWGVSPAALQKGVALDAELEAPLPLPWKVQLVAHGPAGPRPVAERWVAEPGRGTASGAAAHDTLRSSDREVDGSVDLGSLLADLRALRDRPRLRDNRLLREVAAAHAREVCEQGRVAHELRTGRGPAERLAHAGLSARLIGETIARASDAPAAFEALQHSPSHLLTLLEPRFTDFGVGVADDRAGKRCYVVVLCAWPRRLARSGQ